MNTLSGVSWIAAPTLAGILMLFGIVLAIVWVVLPFAVIGMKPLLRELIAETKRTNSLLEAEARARARADGAPELITIRAER